MANARPMVAIVGRPNVGKSTFFNSMAGERKAIVEDIPGITRDRIYADVEWLGRPFTLIDTGGIEPASEDILLRQMRRQAQIAIETAQVILFFVDAKEGLSPADEDVADMLRRSHKPVIVVANKVDHFPNHEAYYDFYALGMGEPVPISSSQKLGFGDLLDEVIKLLPQSAAEGEEGEDERIHVAVVGRPNVGKSSLVNTLLREERVIVSDIPGTTRDAIDTELAVGEDTYVLIDTAGLRKKSRIDDKTVERYSAVRALSAVRRCDVALIVVDAQHGVSEQETKIAGYVHEQGKAAVVVVNKWDLIEKSTGTLEKYARTVRASLQFMDYVQVLFISAKSGQRVHKVMDAVRDAFAQAKRRVPTGLLNDVIGEAIAMHEPPIASGRRPRLYYATQVSVRPPTFVFFVNDPDIFHFSYMRYLENHLRKSFGFAGTPIRLLLRARKKEESV
nr:ribosome biogenesis GTPase Der [Maliibacterium massiliense]